MKRPGSLAKVAALVSSIGLVAAFVAYRVVRASPGRPAPPPSAAPKEPSADPAEFLPGSKSAIFIPEPAAPGAKPDGPPTIRLPKTPKIFYGSKSAPMIEPEDVEKAKKQEAPK